MTERRVSERPVSGRETAEAPWAILPAALPDVVEALRRASASVSVGDYELPDRTFMAVEDGVARITVRGELLAYEDLYTWYWGTATYEGLTRDLQAALADDAVNAVLLVFDSVGGMVAGCDEFQTRIFDARGTKPLVAYVSGHACSAAYWIASACDEVIASPTAILGSIGTCVSYFDDSGFLEQHGFRRVEIVSSRSPRKNLSPASAEGRSEVVVMLDALADVFIGAVARNREVSVDTVLESYGQGGVMVGADAVRAGLADALGSYEEVVRALAAENADALAPDGVRLVASATADSEAAKGGPNTQAKESDMAKRTLRAARRLMAGAGANGPNAADEEQDEKKKPDESAEGDEEQDEEEGAEGDEEDEEEESAEGDEEDEEEGAEGDEEEEEKPATSARDRRLIALGMASERKRLAAIDAVALPGHAKLIATAKAQGWSVSKTARRVLAAEKRRQGDHLAAFQDDMPASKAPRGFAKSVNAETPEAAANYILNAGKGKPTGQAAKAGR